MEFRVLGWISVLQEVVATFKFPSSIGLPSARTAEICWSILREFPWTFTLMGIVRQLSYSLERDYYAWSAISKVRKES